MTAGRRSRRTLSNWGIGLSVDVLDPDVLRSPIARGVLGVGRGIVRRSGPAQPKVDHTLNGRLAS